MYIMQATHHAHDPPQIFLVDTSRKQASFRWFKRPRLFAPFESTF